MTLTNDRAQFTATLASVTSNKTNSVIKLSMANKDYARFSQFLLKSLDKDVVVAIGDPQLAMEFDDDTPTGRPYQVDSSGVVGGVQTDEEGEQTELDIDVEETDEAIEGPSPDTSFDDDDDFDLEDDTDADTEEDPQDEDPKEEDFDQPDEPNFDDDDEAWMKEEPDDHDLKLREEEKNPDDAA